MLVIVWVLVLQVFIQVHIVKQHLVNLISADTTATTVHIYHAQNSQPYPWMLMPYCEDLKITLNSSSQDLIQGLQGLQGLQMALHSPSLLWPVSEVEHESIIVLGQVEMTVLPSRVDLGHRHILLHHRVALKLGRVLHEPPNQEQRLRGKIWYLHNYCDLHCHWYIKTVSVKSRLCYQLIKLVASLWKLVHLIIIRYHYKNLIFKSCFL